MTKIFIDTNKFLDFYRYEEENEEVLDKLALANNILITEQVIEEFNRNRFSEIRRLLENVESKAKDLNDGLCNLKPVGIFAEKISTLNKNNSKLIQEIKTNFKPLKEEINSMLNDDSNDVVFNAFNMIINNEQTTIIKDNEKAYNLALKRNRLGGVPRSDNKYLTICDEYIWESLLLNSKDNIIFVTRDKTYLDNQKILIEEFKKKTGKSIKFMELVSTALKELGADISKEAIEKEQHEQNEILLLDALSDVTGVNVDEIEYELLTLTEREEKVIRLRFGLEDGKKYTLEDISKMFGISKETVRQIEAKAICKMRNRYVHRNTNSNVIVSL